jgi:predicted permease
MSLWRRLVSGYRTLVFRGRLDRDLDDELAAYLDGLIDRKIRAGVDPATARRAALIEIGGVEQVRQDVLSGRVGHSLDVSLQDFRYAWRGLRKAPAFTAIVLLTLAVGIGANVAVFSVVNAMLLAPLPFRDSGRLVFVWSDMSDIGYPRAPLSGPELGDLRARSRLFTGFGAIWSNTAAIGGDGTPEQLRIGRVTSDFFSVLGVEPLMGRTFRDDDEVPGASGSVLLSWSLWQRRYGGDVSVVGRRVLLNNQPATIIGVMPAEFRLLMPPDASVPNDLQAWVPFGEHVVDGPRGQQFLRVIGRMRPGVTLDAAQGETTRIASEISRQFPEYGNAGRVFRLVSLHADHVRDIKAPLLTLFAGVAILLVIACVNVAALLVARTASRSRETALRMALGAGRIRLLRQCLAEGLLLTGLGGLAGLIVGPAGLKVLLALRPHGLDSIATARIDVAVLISAGGTALAWGLLCALSPLAEMWRTDLTTMLAQVGRTIYPASRSTLRVGLVIVQLAFSVVLLVGASLLVRTFINLQRVDVGFRSSGLLTFRLALSGDRYDAADTTNAFARRLESALLELPGVTAVGAISHLPYDDLPNWGGPYLAERGADESQAAHADYRAVTPGLLQAISAQLVEGRLFAESDDQRHDPVVIVDDVLAARAWPGRSAIGQSLDVDPWSSGHPTARAKVVGVVRHLRLRSLVEPLSEQVFFPQRQILRNPMAYVVRASNRSALAQPIRDVVSRLDRQLPIYDVRPLDDYVTAAQSTRRFTMVLVSVFASAAVALACVGVYGVMASSVTRRRREFGVRLALGARPDQIVKVVLREGAVLTLIGLALGLLGATAAAHLLRTQLFGVAPDDGASYATAVLLLAPFAVAACFIPARRATMANPLEVLRAE